MRYYTITFSDSTTGQPLRDANGQQIGPFTSLKNGQTILGALDVEFDVPMTTFDAPMGAAFVKVHGVGLQTISNAANINDANVKLYVGMAKGLPLANPGQQGLILDGTVQQAFGNWQGTQQSLDIVAYANSGTEADPLNFVLDWRKGQQLGDALVSAIQGGMPSAKVVNEVKTNLTLTTDNQPGFYSTLGRLANYVNSVSRDMVGGDYTGVRIIPTQGGVLISDGTTPKVPTVIAFTDLIGQPTWGGPNVINFKVVMRGDIQVDQFVRLPKGQTILTAQSYDRYRDKTTFNGLCRVQSVRHMGHFRQRTADSWVTVIEASAIPETLAL